MEAASIGAQIKKRREERGLSLSRLSELAQVSKGYLWSLEKGESKARPSGETLYRIAEALGVTMSDLLGRKLLIERLAPEELPTALAEFAERERLPQTDVEMLAKVNFRGAQPQTVSDWDFVYRAIQRSVSAAPQVPPQPATPRPPEKASRRRTARKQ